MTFKVGDRVVRPNQVKQEVYTICKLYTYMHSDVAGVVDANGYKHAFYLTNLKLYTPAPYYTPAGDEDHKSEEYPQSQFDRDQRDIFTCWVLDFRMKSGEYRGQLWLERNEQDTRYKDRLTELAWLAFQKGAAHGR